MTGTEIYALLGSRLEDPNGDTFTTDLKRKAVNLALRTVITLADNSQLKELEQLVEDAEFVAGSTDNIRAGAKPSIGGLYNSEMQFRNLPFSTVFSSKPYPIPNGILAIQSQYHNQYRLLNIKDLSTLENSYIQSGYINSSETPVAFIWKEVIYALPYTGYQSEHDKLNIYYIGRPLEFVSSSAVAGTSQLDSAECDLGPYLQEPLIDFAEAQLWKMDGKIDRANISQTYAFNMMKVLTERGIQEQPKMIGADK